MNKTNGQDTTIPPSAPAPSLDSTPPAANSVELWSGPVNPLPPVDDSTAPGPVPPSVGGPDDLLSPDPVDNSTAPSAAPPGVDWYDSEEFEDVQNNSQERARKLFFVILCAAVFILACLNFKSYWTKAEVVKTKAPKPATRKVATAPAPKVATTPEAEVKATETTTDDTADDTADEGVEEGVEDTAEEGAAEESSSPSKLHEEELPEIPEVDEFDLSVIDYDKLVAEELRKQAQVQAQKATQARVAKLQKCLKGTKAKISRNLFRKGKAYGDWTPSRKLQNGKCRTLKYTRKLEADTEVFHDAIAKVLKREIDNYTVSLDFDDVDGTVTITLLSPEERAEMKWEDRRAARLAKVRAQKIKLASKLAQMEIAKRKLAKEKYVPRGLAAKLIAEGRVLFNDGLKGAARTKWREAKRANPTKTQKQKIKLYLTLK